MSETYWPRRIGDLKLFEPKTMCPLIAVRDRLEAAGGNNLEVFSPTIGRQLLEQGLIDEIDGSAGVPR
jgi:hypothetical protein